MNNIALVFPILVSALLHPSFFFPVFPSSHTPNFISQGTRSSTPFVCLIPSRMPAMEMEKEAGQSVQGVKYKQNGKREKVKESWEWETEPASSFLPPPALHSANPQRGINSWREYPWGKDIVQRSGVETLDWSSISYGKSQKEMRNKKLPGLEKGQWKR